MKKEMDESITGEKLSAASLAASKVIQFFKQKEWKIISFFPNSPCVPAHYLPKQTKPKH